MRTSKSDPLKIAEIEIGENKVGLSLCPGKHQTHPQYGDAWHRDLDIDLIKIKNNGYDTVLTLIEDHEMQRLRVKELRRGRVEYYGMSWIWAPITDQGVPENIIYSQIEQGLETIISGKSLFIHCMGGLGRAGLITAWILTHFGRTAEDAIREVRTVRPGAIENIAQEQWVMENSEKNLI